jgi:hypothetical protein
MRIFAAIFVLCTVAPATAEVFHSRESALKSAFPGATHVKQFSLFLSANDTVHVRKKSGVEQSERVVNVYAGYQNGALLGHAFIDTHQVRTMPETLMVVVTPGGSLKQLLMLAFHEPSEYKPSMPWLGQFQQQTLNPGLSLRNGIDGISGATLTSQAITATTRRILALYKLKVMPRLARAQLR